MGKIKNPHRFSQDETERLINLIRQIGSRFGDVWIDFTQYFIKSTSRYPVKRCTCICMIYDELLNKLIIG